MINKHDMSEPDAESVEHRVLLTGAAGRIGSWLRTKLPSEYSLRVFDRTNLDIPAEASANEERVRGDIRSLDDVQRAVRGCAAVVHLAGIAQEAPFDDILEANIRGTYNVFEACRRENCDRVVVASSNHAIGFYPVDQMVSADMPPRPDSFYGLSKAYGELLARLYFDRFGIQSANIRIGSFKDRPDSPRDLRTMISRRDLTQLIRRCIDVPDLGYVVVHGVSNNRTRWWINDSTQHLGFQPQDDAWALGPELATRPVGYRFSGGAFAETPLGEAGPHQSTPAAAERTPVTEG